MAVSWLQLLRSQRLGRFQLPLALLLHRSGMRCVLLSPLQAMCGSMGTGEFGAGVMYGFLACGSGLRMQELIGAIRTTTTTPTAGTCMRAIGIMRTMAITMMSTTVTRQMFCEEKNPAFSPGLSLPH